MLKCCPGVFNHSLTRIRLLSCICRTMYDGSHLFCALSATGNLAENRWTFAPLWDSVVMQLEWGVVVVKLIQKTSVFDW